MARYRSKPVEPKYYEVIHDESTGTIYAQEAADAVGKPFGDVTSHEAAKFLEWNEPILRRTNKKTKT